MSVNKLAHHLKYMDLQYQFRSSYYNFFRRFYCETEKIQVKFWFDSSEHSVKTA